MKNQEKQAPSITFLNSTGDITITWDKKDEPAILALIEAKMADKYHFFLLKPRFLGIFGKRKVQAKNIEEVRAAGSVVASDDIGRDVIMNLGDPEVARAVANGDAKILGVEKKQSIESVGRATTAREVLNSQTLAVRPIVGG